MELVRLKTKKLHSLLVMETEIISQYVSVEFRRFHVPIFQGLNVRSGRF